MRVRCCPTHAQDRDFTVNEAEVYATGHGRYEARIGRKALLPAWRLLPDNISVGRFARDRPVGNALLLGPDEAGGECD